MILAALRPAEAPLLAPDSAAGIDTGGRPAIIRYDDTARGAIEAVGNRLSITSGGNGIVSIEATMPDPLAAADLTLAASNQLTTWVIEYEAKKATELLRFYEEKVAESKARVERIQREQALFTDRTRGTVSATAQLEAARLQREYTLALDTYQRFASSAEQARIKKSEDTPVFTVLEQVTVPESPSAPRRGRILILSVIFGVLSSIGIIVTQRLAVIVRSITETTG